MKSSSLPGLLSGLIIAASVPTLHADLKATDNAVPSIMDAGGTAENPAQYIMGYTPGYTKSVSRFVSGWSNSYNAFVVQGGANITGDGALWTGVQTTSNYNSILLTQGSTWSLGGDYLIAGSGGSNNSIRVEDGSSVTGGSFIFVGDNVGINNSLTISGLGSSVFSSDGIYLGYQGATGGTLTIENGGLLRLDANYWNALSIATDNYLQFDGGYFAWKGNWAESIEYLADSGKFKAWDGTEFINITSQAVTMNYYATDAAGLAATGIDGLGGYTVATAVPEPSTWFLIGAGAIGVAVGMRRKWLTVQ